MIVRAFAPPLTAVMLSLTVTMAPGPAWAEFDCGNGVLNLGEECDDGNLIAGDCCSPGCSFEPATTICRAAVVPCDAAEHCTGDSDTCPLDTGILGDTDADGICDALDVCPAVSDPEQLDRDGDGIGDACDPCTDVFGTMRSFRLRVRKLDYAFGQQRLRYRAFVTVPLTPPIDPIAKAVRLVMTDAGRRTVFDVTIPPIPFDPAMRLGWAVLGNGAKWVFYDGNDQVEGVDNASIRVTPASEPNATNLRVVIQSGGNTSATTPMLPVTLTLVLDTPIATEGQCAEVTLDEAGCTFRNQGGKLLCH